MSIVIRPATTASARSGNGGSEIAQLVQFGQVLDQVAATGVTLRFEVGSVTCVRR
jgi:hypothetical protein